jgi:hypothetical protein
VLRSSSSNRLILHFLGAPSGLSGTHDQFESDSSPTRCDLYEWYVPASPCSATPYNWCSGDNYSTQPAVFQDLLDILAANPDPRSNLQAIYLHRVRRLRYSIANNPFFFYGPIEMVRMNILQHSGFPMANTEIMIVLFCTARLLYRA